MKILNITLLTLCIPLIAQAMASQESDTILVQAVGIKDVPPASFIEKSQSPVFAEIENLQEYNGDMKVEKLHSHHYKAHIGNGTLSAVYGWNWTGTSWSIAWMGPKDNCIQRESRTHRTKRMVVLLTALGELQAQQKAYAQK